jgi:hypothetical protein
MHSEWHHGSTADALTTMKLNTVLHARTSLLFMTRPELKQILPSVRLVTLAQALTLAQDVRLVRGAFYLQWHSHWQKPESA